VLPVRRGWNAARYRRSHGGADFGTTPQFLEFGEVFAAMPNLTGSEVVRAQAVTASALTANGRECRVGAEKDSHAQDHIQERRSQDTQIKGVGR
jgi:hypothetical protein